MFYLYLTTFQRIVALYKAVTIMKGKFQGFENLYVRKTHFSKNFSLQNVVYGEKIKRALYTLHDEMHIIHI